MNKLKWVTLATMLTVVLTACGTENSKPVESAAVQTETEEVTTEEKTKEIEVIEEVKEETKREEIEKEEELKEVQEVEETEELSKDFLDYNQRYYKGFKSNLDLIAGNFELIYDGYETSALIDDLIVWTNEFNGLLDVYEQNAFPENETDRNLYAITQQMIAEQREANKNIIEGLQNNDDLPLLIAGEYINTSTELFLEGYSLIQ